jgi:uncharacterized double-CXXCG motif protein
MRIFEMQRDDERWHADYSVEARRPWSLPVVKCETCGRIVDVHLVYPALVLPEGLDPRPYQSGWPVTRQRLAELIAPLRKVMGPSLPLGPGTQFGPLKGTARGKHGDFTWLGGLPLISPMALRRLKSTGAAEITIFPTEIISTSGNPLPHQEIFAARSAKVSPDGFGRAALNPCPECGYIDLEGSDFEKWGKYKVQSSSVPTDKDVFAVCEVGTILARDQFADAVLRLRLSNITFREVEIVNYSVIKFLKPGI